MMECPLKCGKKYTIPYLENVHYDECINAVVKCPKEMCDDVYLRREVECHKIWCRYELIKCTNDCGRDIQRGQMKDHHKYSCPHQLIECRHC